MTISFGSAQTNGLPLVVTAVTEGARQLLHTFPVGSATPNLVQIFAQNLDTDPLGTHTLYVAFEDSGATLLHLFTVNVPVNSGLFDVLSAVATNDSIAQLVANGASTIKVYADEASMLAVYARVDNQADAAGIVQQIPSGLIAAVQNANRFGTYVNGGVGDATEANGNIKISRAGTLSNLRAAASAAVGGGATVTVAVRVNGVSSALSLTFANADGTADKVDTDSVTVAAGDLVTFLVSCDNVGAPAANFQAVVEFQPA